MSEEEIVNNNLNKFKNWICEAGKSYLYIHYDGYIYPCQSFMSQKIKPIGSIYDNTIPILRKHICLCDICECGITLNKQKLFK